VRFAARVAQKARSLERFGTAKTRHAEARESEQIAFHFQSVVEIMHRPPEPLRNGHDGSAIRKDP
jgi:hypothetical protein